MIEMPQTPKATARATATETAQPAEGYPDTPSGKALDKVGALAGEDVDPDGYEAANEHGESYQKEKRKHRWGE